MTRYILLTLLACPAIVTPRLAQAQAIDFKISELPTIEEPTLTSSGPTLDWVNDYILLYDASANSNGRIRAKDFRNQLFPYIQADKVLIEIGSGGNPTALPFTRNVEATIPSMHDPVTSLANRRFIAPRDGTYQFLVAITYLHQLEPYEPPIGYSYSCIVRKTIPGPPQVQIDVLVEEHPYEFSRYHSLRTGGTVDMTKDEYLEVYTWHNRGESMPLRAEFTMWRIQ